MPLTFLCLASYEKGHDFLRELKAHGCTVLLLTSQSLQGKANWPVEAIDDIFYMPDQEHKWNREHTLNAVSYLARSRWLDRIVPLDDFDVEVAAMLREHLRIPGMGESTGRYFRDKLAMRMKGQEAGLRVPPFVHTLNYDRIRAFTNATPPPRVLKPRSMAGAIGIKKVNSTEELWPILDSLGDLQSHYLLERFIPGDVFHVDTIVYERKVMFAIASGYGRPPMEVSHSGGIFTTTILDRESEISHSLLETNERVMAALGMLRGVSHTEFIRSHEDRQIYFLETSARVGGAHIADLIEAATGINLWREWAKVEIASGKEPYSPPAPRNDYAALLVSLARQQHPDTSAYTDPEVVWRLDREYHVGMILRSPSLERVQQLLAEYVERVKNDFQAVLPPRETAAH